MLVHFNTALYRVEFEFQLTGKELLILLDLVKIVFVFQNKKINSIQFAWDQEREKKSSLNFAHSSNILSYNSCFSRTFSTSRYCNQPPRTGSLMWQIFIVFTDLNKPQPEQPHSSGLNLNTSAGTREKQLTLLTKETGGMDEKKKKFLSTSFTLRWEKVSRPHLTIKLKLQCRKEGRRYFVYIYNKYA